MTTGISATAAASPALPSKSADPALEKAAKAFEAIFVRQMIGAMRSASLGEGMLDSSATEQFRDMSDARTAQSMADKNAMGIADILLRQLSPIAAAQAGTGLKAPDGPKAPAPDDGTGQ